MVFRFVKPVEQKSFARTRDPTDTASYEGAEPTVSKLNEFNYGEKVLTVLSTKLKNLIMRRAPVIYPFYFK
jgi:hypothetical protein